MLVYGTRTKIIKTEYIADPCPNCKAQGSMQMNIWQQWAHAFWIPFFPITKIGSTECTRCHQVLSFEKMPLTLRVTCDNMKAQTNRPVWTFTGIGVMVVTAIVVNVSERQTANKVTQMISSLKKNDILHIKLKDNVYTLAKVSRVKKDSVFLFANNYQIDRAADINDLRYKGYATTEDTLTVADLIDMNKKERILDIERK